MHEFMQNTVMRHADNRHPASFTGGLRMGKKVSAGASEAFFLLLLILRCYYTKSWKSRPIWALIITYFLPQRDAKKKVFLTFIFR
jgi:hypothetical protein